MSITRLQQARQMYAMGQRVAKTLDGSRPGYRGDDAYGSSSRSRQATDSRAATSSTNSSAPGGSSGQETRGDGPSSSDRQTNTREDNSPQATGNSPPLQRATPMDVKEQYSVGNDITLGDPIFPPTVSPFVENNRQDNYIDALNLAGSTYNPVKTPSVFVNTLANLAGGLGYKKNTQFFANNVAGKYGYDYGVEDYEKYMKDRLGGLINAYGRTLNEGEIGYRSNDGENGSGGIMDVYNAPNYTDDGDGDADGDGDVDQTDDFIFRYFDKTGETLQSGAGGVQDLMTRIRQRISNIFS